MWKPKQVLSPGQVGVMEGGHGTPQRIFGALQEGEAMEEKDNVVKLMEKKRR